MAFEKSTSSLTILIIATISVAIVLGQGHGLSVGFYDGICQQNVEDIVFKVVQEFFINDNTIAAALLRLQFHDCFVTGCDASILLNGIDTEKTASPNGSVRGYDLIDAAKEAVEESCADTVSCADIIAIATRDAVFLQSGGFRYEVETGRLDGLFSLAANTIALPSPTIEVASAIEAFADRELNAEDFVLLLGAHTVGVTHCSFVQDRIDSSSPDPPMDPTFKESLMNVCPSDNSGANNLLFLDQLTGSGNFVDDGFYKTIKNNMGLLPIDQRIANDELTKDFVNDLLLKGDFLPRFGEAMVKLGRVPGTGGEIRKSCAAVNT